jgi:hypothetical protein
MAKQTNNQELIKRLHSLEAYHAGAQLECQQIRKLLEAADVSTPANSKQPVSKIAIEARTRLRERLLK